jgi:hypothetical protein
MAFFNARSHRLLCVPCKGTLNPRVEIPTGNVSSQPEALGAVQEETNGLKHSKKRLLLGSQQAVQAATCSEHRAGPENVDAEVDPPQ